MRMAGLAILTLVLCAPAAIAQETQTEREAAREVLAKMAALERSLDVPALVAKLTAADAARDAVAARAKALMAGELLALSDDICTHPEVGYKETRSVEKLTAALRAHDFDVQVGAQAAAFDTAFVARYRAGTGAPHLGVIVEYDALRGTQGAFHGDQHCAQGPIGIAAAVAVAEFLTKNKLPGTVTVFGTPAEELLEPSAKTVMHEKGVFDGMDVIVRSHASTQTSRPAPGFGTCCLNIDGVKFTFSGAPAHQMTSWNGRNALEGVIHLFNNIDAVRSSLRPETRIQGIITEGGAAPNVVPDRAQADFYIRYPDEVYLRQVREFVDNAAKAAALATGTKVRIDTYGQARDGISTATLAEGAFALLKVYGAGKVNPDPGKPQGYEESGSVSRDIPGIGFSGYTSDWPNHTYEMDQDNLKPVGHNGFTVQAQAMAALLHQFATRADYRAAVKKEFDGIKALFGEYLQALEKTYKTPVVTEPKGEGAKEKGKR
ncbi:MAG TPA: peptidase dimerization domain-containing protein [Vicinamibacterales bacterium]|nr:peptidase dimerization domain-containing protein [Vicinamibacterales bacterium]